MPFASGVRLKLLHLVKDALNKQNFFKAVNFQMPTTQPTALDVPQAWIALGVESMSGHTALEKDSEFRMSVIIFVRAEGDVDLAKVEAMDEAEEELMSLQINSDFQAIASMIDVETADYGPVALQAYGLDLSVTPPFGVVRLDVVVTFSYEAIS